RRLRSSGMSAPRTGERRSNPERDSPDDGRRITNSTSRGTMMQSAHLRWKKRGALALAVVASSATTIVLAQTPASAATPVSADPHYTVSQLASGLSSPANGLLFRATTNDLLVSEF